MKRIATWLLALLVTAFPAAATTSSTDYTDLWWNAPDFSEDGWGVNVIQQGDVVFATFFVYDPDGMPRWYVASNLGALASPPGQNIFTGPLYSTTGTYFGVPWSGAAIPTQVGTATLTFTSASTGTLAYNVGAVNIIKNIKRQTWRGNNLAGNYFAGTTARGSNCGGGVDDGLILIYGEMSVSHPNFDSANPSTVNISVDFVGPQGNPGTCTYVGAYTQAGKMGSMTGNFSCTQQGVANPPSGTFTLTEIQATRNGLSSRYTARDQFCDYQGFFGGVRDVI